MSRKKKHEHVNHERWLVSYADFITLLFAFFVVLFASGQSDKRKQVKLATSIQSAFDQLGIFEAHSKAPPLTETSGAAGDGLPAALALPLITAPAPHDVIEQHIRDAARHEIGSGTVRVQQSAGGIVISLQEAGFFDSGVAEIRPSALSVLDRIAAQLPSASLRVEGHTDDVPIRTAQYASNWELSSARASSIARLLLHHANVSPQSLSVAGYAEFHPIATNATEAGRARNRRVDIIVLPPSPISTSEASGPPAASE